MKVEPAPDDIVETHKQGAGNQREPLLVLGPLRDFLAGAGSGRAGGPDGDAVRRGPLERDLTGSRPGSCCADRRVDRCRPAHTTCCARRACLQRSTRRRCGRPACWPCATTTRVIGAPFYVMEEIARRRDHDAMPEPLDNPEQRRPVADELDRRRWSSCTPSIGPRSGSRGSASRPATSSDSCAASTACGSTTGRARYPRSSRSARGLRPTCPSRRRRRSCTATTGSATRCSRTARRLG